MTQEMKEIQDEQKRQGRVLEEILIAVSGNTKLGIKGIAKRMDSNDAEIQELKAWRNKFNLKVAYTAGAVAGGMFGGLEGIKGLIELLHK